MEWQNIGRGPRLQNRMKLVMTHEKQIVSSVETSIFELKKRFLNVKLQKKKTKQKKGSQNTKYMRSGKTVKRKEIALVQFFEAVEKLSSRRIALAKRESTIHYC